VTDRQTDGQTDGIVIAYTRYSIYAVARKNGSSYQHEARYTYSMAVARHALTRRSKVKGQGHTVTKTFTVAWLLGAAVSERFPVTSNYRRRIEVELPTSTNVRCCCVTVIYSCLINLVRRRRTMPASSRHQSGLNVVATRFPVLS